MKKLCVLWCAAVLLAAMSARAIDREADMIDRVSIDFSSLDDADSIGGSIFGETALATPGDRWAILFGGGMGSISPLRAEDVSYWNILLGLRLYALPVTSISLFGKYESFNAPNTDNRDAKGATAQIRQRMTPADWSVSPFLQAGFTLRERSSFTMEGTEGSFSEYIVAGGGGCEFAANDELSFVFEAYYQWADASEDGTEDLDGFTASVSMVYYWY